MNAERKFIKNKLCRYVHIIKKGLQKNVLEKIQDVRKFIKTKKPIELFHGK